MLSKVTLLQGVLFSGLGYLSVCVPFRGPMGTGNGLDPLKLARIDFRISRHLLCMLALRVTGPNNELVPH